jgi:Na+/melibiose symporter-like transporter
MRESISRPRRVVCITASLLTAAPASALACPVCALIGPSNNTWAYQAMSVMLTLLPLAMVGATVWWLARLAARAETEEEHRLEWKSLPRSSYVASGFSRNRDADLPPEGGSHVPQAR